MIIEMETQDELNEKKRAQEKNKKTADVQARLEQIDTESIRPLRAKLAGNNTKDDDKKLADLEQEAKKLRKDLSEL